MEVKPLITPQELVTLSAQEPVVVINTREAEEYEVSHIPGAVNIREIFTYLANSTPKGLANWKFIEQMPLAPAALIDDLIKMGHYTPETLELAEQFTEADRKALILQMIAGAPPEQRQLCNDLIKAGGLEEAFSAALGPSAAEFFGDMTRASKFSRRDFLTKVAATAAIVTLASCAQNAAKSPTEGVNRITILWFKIKYDCFFCIINYL